MSPEHSLLKQKLKKRKKEKRKTIISFIQLNALKRNKKCFPVNMVLIGNQLIGLSCVLNFTFCIGSFS